MGTSAESPFEAAVRRPSRRVPGWRFAAVVGLIGIGLIVSGLFYVPAQLDSDA